MSLTKSDTLHVPGASLYYEMRGSGPILLLIHGGGGDARGFNGIANYLVNQYTVVTYDRRGLSRSKLDDPEEEQRVETHSDDAHLLLKELSTEPAYVFGSSGGAIIGLDLASRYNEQVNTLVAHEPPSHLLPEAEGRHDNIREVYRHEGMASAMQKFMAQVGANYSDLEPGVQLPDPRDRPAQNTVFLLEHELAMYDRYQLDFAALSKASSQTRIVIAAGQSGREYLGYRNAAAVAERLGTTVVEFPSHHAGYITHPGAFSDRLYDVLSNEQGK
jgi:pimeloyl-ACP methyl ester carboxylesterase